MPKKTTKATPAIEAGNMNDEQFRSFLNDLRTLVDNHLAGLGGADAAPSKPSKPSKAAEVADEPDEDDDDVEADERAERRAELEGMTIAALRKAAKKAGFDPDEVKNADQDEIIESLLDDEFGESDEDEDADEDEAEEEEEDEAESEYSRDDLEGMGLRELKRIAKEAGNQPSEMKGFDKEQVIDLILGESEEDDEDEDEDEADDDEDDFYDEEDLQQMSLAELKALAKEWEVRLKPGMKKPQIIDALLEDDE